MTNLAFTTASMFLKKAILFIVICLANSYAYGQEYMYVNTDNLILRDRPEKVYVVFAILHAACKVRIEPYESGYKNDKKATSRFYQVSITYNNDGTPGEDGIMEHYVGGWVEKRYLVSNLDKISVPIPDEKSGIVATEIALEPYMGDDEHNPNNGNARLFKAPKFKGGEKQPAPFKRIYHTGPRGGCFYMSEKGTKVYVDGKLCNGK